MPTQGDPLRTFSPGDPLSRIGAVQANQWNDAARAYRRSQRTGAPNVVRSRPGSLEILVRNDTGTDLDERAVVQVSSPIGDPTVYGVDLQDTPAFMGVVPTGTAGTPAVLLEPVADGSQGRAVIMGVAVVSVDITDAGHTKATLDTGSTAALVSGTSGPVTILWRETGTGVKLCAVLLCCGTGIPAVGEPEEWPDTTAPSTVWYCTSGACAEQPIGDDPPTGASGPFVSMEACQALCGGGGGGGGGAGTIETSCCSELLPEALYVTISDGGGSHPMTWDGMVWKTGVITVPGCGTIAFVFACSTSPFEFYLVGDLSHSPLPTCRLGSATGASTTTGCSGVEFESFAVTHTVLDYGGGCGCDSLTRTFTVTP